MRLAIYGKGGIGKSTTSCNISVALAKRGKRVLQIGCDPKHDSTFTLTGFLIPTIIDTLKLKNYHYENIWPEDVIYKGYGGVHCVEAGGPPAGAGCGGYVVGETVKLLKELNAFDEYDIILFDVLGDVVCGGFAAPLNYAEYCLIVTDNGFDALFAANRISASVLEKAKTHSLRLAGLIGNRTATRDLIDKYTDVMPIPVLEVLPLIEEIRVSRVKGKTLFEMAEFDQKLDFVCDYYLNIADQLIANPEGVVPNQSSDRELFSLLSDFYLKPSLSDKSVINLMTLNLSKIDFQHIYNILKQKSQSLTLQNIRILLSQVINIFITNKFIAINLLGIIVFLYFLLFLLEKKEKLVEKFKKFFNKKDNLDKKDNFDKKNKKRNWSKNSKSFSTKNGH